MIQQKLYLQQQTLVKCRSPYTSSIEKMVRMIVEDAPDAVREKITQWGGGQYWANFIDWYYLCPLWDRTNRLAVAALEDDEDEAGGASGAASDSVRVPKNDEEDDLNASPDDGLGLGDDVVGSGEPGMEQPDPITEFFDS